MYKIELNDWKILGIDDNNIKNVILDTEGFIHNRSRIGVHYLTVDDMAVAGLVNAVYKRFGEIPRQIKDGIREYAWMVTECQIVQYLIGQAAPIDVAIIDSDSYVADRYEDVISYFKNAHCTFRIYTDKARGYKSCGFKVVTIEADDNRAEQQIKLAADLVSDDGIVLCTARDTMLFQRLLRLVTKPKDEYYISQNCSVITVNGFDINRELMQPLDLDAAYSKCCARVVKAIQTNDTVPQLRRICVELKELAKEAQKQWNLPMKQQFLDLKEAIQYYFLNLGDKYEDYYRSELDAMLQLDKQC